MITNLTAKDLINFEDRVADAFNSGLIKAPVYLYHGNENQMIEVFGDVKEQDWIMCSWRSHYQCLLKGVPEDVLYRDILAGRSISLCYPNERIFSSAIVGGSISIATGIALSILKKDGRNRVHCFVGDMTAETGIAHECIKYSENFDLPIRFIVEDNRKSVCTDTYEAWGMSASSYLEYCGNKVVYYQYETRYPHAGAGELVQF